jgi:hypothetical protein
LSIGHSVQAQPHKSIDALAAVDRQVERLKWRFDFGYATEEEFAEKMAFLRSEREEIAKPVSVKVPITGLVQAWDSGDNITRLALLRNMFAGLIIRGDDIIDYEPRPEVAAEPRNLLDGYAGFGGRYIPLSSLA